MTITLPLGSDSPVLDHLPRPSVDTMWNDADNVKGGWLAEHNHNSTSV